MADAGRILIIAKGNYDPNVAYEMLDLVKHNDTAWLAKKTCIGIEPSEDNSEHWFELLTTDATKLGGETAGEWQSKINAMGNSKAEKEHVHEKEDVGLGNVNNTADADKSVKYAESAGAVSWENVSGKPDSFEVSAHTHAASNITAGTLSGKVVANATAVATLANKQVRNIYAGTSTMTAGTTALPSGDIYIKYK